MGVAREVKKATNGCCWHMTKSSALNGEFLTSPTFPEPWNSCLCSGEDAPTQIVCCRVLLRSSPDGISQRCPGGQLHILTPSAHLSHLFCSQFMAHPPVPVPSLPPSRRPPRRAADGNDPQTLTSCKADLTTPAFTMETSNTPNGSQGSKLHPLTPISG